MDGTTTLAALLHILVFAYWLGGDVGAFYASTIVSDARRAPHERAAAGRFLADVDLAPRISLVFALPTGLALARAAGWMEIATGWIAAAFAAAAAWSVSIMRLHSLRGQRWLAPLDRALRLAMIVGLGGAAAAGATGALAMPAFIAAKLALLAFCVAVGLAVRALLAPFAPAFARLAAHGPDAAGDATIRRALDRARIAVAAIWGALIIAAWLGLSRPA